MATIWDRVELITDGFSPVKSDGILDYYNVRRRIIGIVWHSMEGHFASAIAHWNTGAGGAHLCILATGEVVLSCKLEDAAWHAGSHNTPGIDGYGRTPFWRMNNINPYSVGIELEGFAATGFTPAQFASIRRVSQALMARYAIAPVHEADQLVGHHLHSEISSTRSDPGPFFSWDYALKAA